MVNSEMGLLGQGLVEQVTALFAGLGVLSDGEKIAAINEIRLALHQYSPMRNEPVDCVVWVPADTVEGNTYNPNAVAPPEMRLLERSIEQDGYTQPIVAWQTGEGEGMLEVVDGFHRNRIGKESKAVKKRTGGYLPVVVINQDRTDHSDRVAATIRHNRARGKHQVAQMSEIVQDLSRRNWSDSRIARELGMEADEVLRLKQITGLAELFADEDFSEAWE